MKRAIFIFFFLILIFPVPTISACPLLNGLVDFNCDGIHKIVVTGDSVVHGTGDLRYKNKGGYVLRLKRKLKKSTVINLGYAGYTSEMLYQEFKMNLSAKSESKVKELARNADILIIDVGRNDYFSDVTPGFTVRNIKRLVKLFRSVFNKNKLSSPPYIVVTTLLPTTRGFQREFITGVNTILRELTSFDIPVALYLDTLSEENISSDGIHPDSPGYNAIFSYVYDQILTTIQSSCLIERPDSDIDGIYDRFERTKYKTDFTLSDTDSDRVSDGEEVFTYLTDPLNPDSDGDGILDGEELL